MGSQSSKPSKKASTCCTNNRAKRKRRRASETELTGTEANSLRKELDELKQTLHAKEVEHETERETLMKDVSELRTELENLKQNHEEEIERLQEMHREEVEKTENLQVEVEDAQGKVMEFEVKLHKMVEPRLKELLKPYQNAYEECQSLKSVLDIKNEETRKLQKENAQHRLQLSTNTNLQNFVEKLKHQKEGVDAQLQRLQHEYLSTRDELGRVQMSSSLVERKNDELMREVEEMSFKLNSPQSASMISSQMSPFNPVFTYSTANTMVGDSRIVKQLDMDDTGESTTNNFGA